MMLDPILIRRSRHIRRSLQRQLASLREIRSPRAWPHTAWRRPAISAILSERPGRAAAVSPT